MQAVLRWTFLMLLASLLSALGTACDDPAGAADAGPATQPASAPPGMVLIPGGTFRMGTDNGLPHEAPVHEVTLAPYWIDRHEVTVGEFAKFVEATGYKTESEALGWSGVFDPKQQSWTKGDGADWRHPQGPHSTARPDEPVVHVSFADATAYATWAGKRLPTEAEYEFAARGGLEGKTYAWGDELRPGGKHYSNIWQGTFPQHDEAKDGFNGVAAVTSFPANGYGLHDMTGNVWEWCADWFAADYYSRSPRDNPKGPATGSERVLRGGSWLCSDNYCTGYRVAARNQTAPDSGLNNLGFRCVKDE